MRIKFIPAALLTLLFIFSAEGFTSASSNSSVGATVKLSICGNNIKELGEECDGSDIPRPCTDLGFTGGTIACSVACGFDTASCTVPALDPTNITSTDLDSLLAAGYLTVPSNENITSTSTVTTSQEITIDIPISGGTITIILPQNLTITTADDSNINPTTDLTASSLSTSSVSGLSSGTSAQGVLQWGVTGVTLNFDLPITVTIYVGTENDGKTLDVVRSTSADSGWTSDGIVAPATCVVQNGSCTFQATKASYYAVTKTIPVPTPTPTPAAATTGTSQSTTTTTSTSNPVTLTTSKIVTLIKEIILPRLVLVLDPDGDGKIEESEVAFVFKTWVSSWSNYLKALPEAGVADKNCDVNGDGKCDLRDFSVLLYYVNR